MNKSIYLDEEALAMLDKMAEEDERSRSAMIQWLIRREAERRAAPAPA